jgi:tRNA-dihydrouridine synthase B
MPEKLAGPRRRSPSYAIFSVNATCLQGGLGIALFQTIPGHSPTASANPDALKLMSARPLRKMRPMTAPLGYELKPRTLRLKGLELPSRYCLAPLAGYTTWAFRLGVRALGGLGLATTDLVNPRALLRGNVKSLELISTTAQDRPLAVQIYGNEAREMADAARWLQDYGASVVDINMGCPVNKVTRGGGGSAMLCAAPGQTIELVRQLVAAVTIPVTVKMRLGWDAGQHSAPFFAREFEQVGVAAVTIHGRTRAQGFRGDVDRAGIRAVVNAVERIPVIGNGDIRTVADARRMLAETGCAGIAIGRGALLNPWLFRQLVEEETLGAVATRPAYADHLEFAARHFHRLVDDRGEHHACLAFRKVANWYCRVLKPGHALQARLMLIASAHDFDDIMDRLRERLRREGPPGHWQERARIPVPSGPIAHW